MTADPIAWPVEPRLIRRVGESLALRRRGTGKPHKGIDLFAKAGTPVLAAASGVVRRVVDGTRPGAREGLRRAGWFIDVADPTGRVFRYLHLAANPPVEVGQQVAARSAIAVVGTSGVEHSEPHVHFEIRSSDWNRELRSYGAPLDPLSLLAPREPSPMANTDTAEAEIAVRYLVGQGWSEPAARELLGRKRQDPAKTTADQLRALGWSDAEILRFVSGPEKAAQTAESLYRNLAGASDDTKAAFDQILRQAGAGKVLAPDVKVDGRKVAPSTKKADLTTILSQFSALSADQQKRFLGLLAKEPAGSTSPGKKTSDLDTIYGPLIKGGVDAVTVALKRILGEDSGGKAGGGKGSSKSPPKEKGSGNSDGEGKGQDKEGKEDSGGPDTEEGEETHDDDSDPTTTDKDKAELPTTDDKSDVPEEGDTDIGVIDSPDDDKSDVFDGDEEGDTDIGVIDTPDDKSDVFDGGDPPEPAPADSGDIAVLDASEPN